MTQFPSERGAKHPLPGALSAPVFLNLVVTTQLSLQGPGKRGPGAVLVRLPA